MAGGGGRRDFLRTAGGAALTAGFAGAGLISAREFLLKREREFRKRWRAGRGMIEDPAVLHQYATDFSNLIFELPVAVVYPESVEDVRELMYYCNEHGVPMNTRGVGHACNGQSLISGGIILNMMPGFHGIAMDGDDAVMQSGITWLEAQKFLNAKGRGAPVVPDYMGLTVGGNLSIGGVGTRSLNFGFQSAHIKEMELVTGAGKSVTCSREVEPDLFRFTLHGLGQLSVITSLKTATIAYRPRSLVGSVYFPGYREYTRAMHRLVSDYDEYPFDFLYGFWTHGSFVYFLRVGKDDRGDEAELTKFRSLVSGLGGSASFSMIEDYELWDHNSFSVNVRSKFKWPHIYADTAPPLDLFLEMSDEVYDYLSSNLDIARYMNLYALPFGYRGAEYFPMAVLPGGGRGKTVSVGLEFDLPPGETTLIDKTKEFVSGVMDRWLPRGLAVYMYSWNRLTAAQRRAIWGDALGRFAEVKKATDPNGVINPAGMINSLIV